MPGPFPVLPIKKKSPGNEVDLHAVIIEMVDCVAIMTFQQLAGWDCCIFDVHYAPTFTHYERATYRFRTKLLYFPNLHKSSVTIVE